MTYLNTTDAGYTQLVEPDENGRYKAIYVHRLVAYAHGIIDDLYAPYDINHNCHAWVNNPDTLTAELPNQHRRSHLRGRITGEP